jgi:hypothetical protein
MCIDNLKCYECDKDVTLLTSIFVYCDTPVCNECLKKNYYFCEEEKRYRHNNVEKNIYENKQVCIFCLNNLKKGLKHHCYTPENIVFLHKQDESRENNLHIGIELEIQGSNINNLVLFNKEVKKQYSDYFYLKADGSLNEYGVEIVSYPMTCNYIEHNDIWKKLFKTIQKHNMNNTENCGLHFHLDKTYFTDDNIKVIDYIVNTFYEKIMDLTGRDEYELRDYAALQFKKENEWGTRIYNRYSAVNLENENTIELRFCKSTDDYDVFIERLKLILIIVNIAKQYSFKEVLKFTNIDIHRFFRIIA